MKKIFEIEWVWKGINLKAEVLKKLLEDAHELRPECLALFKVTEIKQESEPEFKIEPIPWEEYSIEQAQLAKKINEIIERLNK